MNQSGSKNILLQLVIITDAYCTLCHRRSASHPHAQARSDRPVACCQRTGATALRTPVCSQLPRVQGIAASLVCRYTSVKGECSAHAQLHVNRTPKHAAHQSNTRVRWALLGWEAAS